LTISSFDNKWASENRAFMILAVALVVASVCVVVRADVESLDKDKIISQVAENWIAVAQKQYKKSMYAQAQKSLIRARQYYQYLSPKQKDNIDELIDKIRNAILQKKQQLEQINIADELAHRGQLLEAKAHLEQLGKSKLLNDAERQKVAADLRRINTQFDIRKQRMKELFEQSRKYYTSGELEKAREGFTEVAASGLYIPSKGMTAEQYLQQMDEFGTAVLSPVVKAADSEEKSTSLLWFWNKGKERELKVPDKTELVDIAAPEPKLDEVSEPQANKYQLAQPLTDAKVSGKNNIRHSYVKAVVRDAQMKVARHLGKGEFGEAKVVVENARIVVEKYRSDISAELFGQFAAELDGLSRMILRQQGKWPY
jgi:hypothetical protein